MTKKEQFDNIKKYCEYLEKAIKKNKQTKKITYGHKTFGLSNNLPFVIGTLVLSFAAMGAALSLLAKLPIYIACPASILTAFGSSIGLPKLLHHLVLKGNGKKSRGYAKLEMDSFFHVMKDIYSKYHKNIMNAQSVEEVSQSDLDAFVEQAKIYTQNYKYYLGKNIGERIYKRNVKDYNKIKKLYSTMNNSNKYDVSAKIQKIVLKNNKFAELWCDLFNTCGKMSKNLYNMTKQICEDLQIPDDKKFEADFRFLNKMIEHDFNIKCEGLNTEQNILNLDIENETQITSKKITDMRNEIQNKKEQHIEEL